MITGTGIDIVAVNRFNSWLDNTALLNRFFHSEEIVKVMKKKAGAAESLAVRFACKEAFGKALGTGLMGLTLKNICVCNDTKGKPFLQLFGDAQEALQKSGAEKIHISLSHEKEYAIAQVILEKERI